MKFLSLQQDAFGLDISDQSIKIIKLKKRGKFFALASFNKIEIKPGIIEKGVIQDEDSLVKIIKAACATVKGEKLATSYVIASLPEEKSFLQVIQMPNMEPKELASAIIFEAENYIPLPVNDVYLDFQTIDPPKNHQNHLDVLIAAMPKKIINSYVSCLKKAGLVPLAFEVESEAIARALIKNDASPVPVALIDFGENSTDLIIFSGHSIQFTCSIPVSSLQLTLAISESLGVDLKKAERLKTKFNLAKVKPDSRSQAIAKAVNPILEDLASQIKKYVNFYQEHDSHENRNLHETIQKIYLCGGGAELQELSSFFSQKLHIPVELGDFWINFAVKKSKIDMRENSLSFITALGLALRGIKNTEHNPL